MTRESIIKIVAFMACLFPGVSWCTDEAAPTEEATSILSGYRIILGVSLHAIDFDVDDTKVPIGDLGPDGTLTEEVAYSPFITLASPYRYYDLSNWGGLVEYSFSTFRLNHQLVAEEIVDLGTSVKGWSVSATPMAFYAFGDKFPHGSRGYSIKFGIGLGLGYLDANGDVIFTETTQEKLSFNVNGLALSIGAFIDARWRDFRIRFTATDTSIEKHDIEYAAFGYSMDFGYIFEF